ncbi:jg2989 [Pararge aegeria aegeria]|uniref:Jg2989 protein n=1 Tax=Pararge aegeria aegeria TaxID=348720 RepID=A0A8S4S8G1_9NEOP|nr:jg2989 [Pararge aegeria aegeria]
MMIITELLQFWLLDLLKVGEMGGTAKPDPDPEPDEPPGDDASACVAELRAVDTSGKITISLLIFRGVQISLKRYDRLF